MTRPAPAWFPYLHRTQADIPEPEQAWYERKGEYMPPRRAKMPKLRKDARPLSPD